jgi:hypothetical protein
MLNRAAGAERDARNLLQRRQRRVALKCLQERRGARVADLIELQAAARSGGSGMLNRAAGAEQGACDLPERRQRRVALECLRQRRGAHVTDPGVVQAFARRGGSGMRDTKAGPPAQSRASATYSRDASVALLLSASDSAAAPASPISFHPRLQRGVRKVRDARGETGPPAQSRARATYFTVVSVAWLLSASESAAAPAAPIGLSFRLLRGEEGQGCRWRDRAASTEQGTRDLRQRRQRRVALERLR